MPPGSNEREAEFRVGYKMAGLAMEVVGQVLACVLLGWLWDRWKGGGNTGVLVGSIIGIVVALYLFIRGALKLNRMLDKQHPTKGRGKPIPYPEDADGDGEPDTPDAWDDPEPKDDWNA